MKSQIRGAVPTHDEDVNYVARPTSNKKFITFVAALRVATWLLMVRRAYHLGVLRG